MTRACFQQSTKGAAALPVPQPKSKIEPISFSPAQGFGQPLHSPIHEEVGAFAAEPNPPLQFQGVPISYLVKGIIARDSSH